MKCIKVVKENKSYKLGTIQRVSDSDADLRVSTGMWAFCPKMEWKLQTRKLKEEVVKANYPANVEGSKEFNEANSKSISEKQLNRKKKGK